MLKDPNDVTDIGNFGFEKRRLLRVQLNRQTLPAKQENRRCGENDGWCVAIEQAPENGVDRHCGRAIASNMKLGSGTLCQYLVLKTFIAI
jgi:hypothetical protein